MRAHEHGPEHDREQDGSPRSAADADALASPELPHLLRAAAAGRTDVVGRAGMGVLQRLAGNSAAGAVLRRDQEEEAPARSSVHDVVAGGGEPLEAGTRADMEARLGADFADVRVHTGTTAHTSAAEVGAHAYTVGNHIVFQRDAYDTASGAGRTTLAHELTHVVQQRQGPVDGAETAGGIRVSDPSDRFEQEAAATAERVMAGPSPAEQAPAHGSQAPSASVQRLADGPAAADVADTPVQRAAEEESKEEDKDEEAPTAG